MSLSSLFRTEGDRDQMTGSTTVDPGGASARNRSAT